MNRFLTFLGAFLMAVPMFGQNTLTIFQKDGQQFSYGFIDKPVISYTDNDLVLKTSKTEVQYPLSSLAKFTFTDVQTSVVPVDENKSDAKLSLDDNVVRIKGTESGTAISVIGSDGKTLVTYKTDAEGCVTFSIDELPEGIYIIQSESLTCKILKK